MFAGSAGELTDSRASSGGLALCRRLRSGTPNFISDTGATGSMSVSSGKAGAVLGEKA